MDQVGLVYLGAAPAWDGTFFSIRTIITTAISSLYSLTGRSWKGNVHCAVRAGAGDGR